MLSRKLKYYAYRLAPGPASTLHRLLRRRAAPRAGSAPTPSDPGRAIRQATALLARTGDLDDPAKLFDLLRGFPALAAGQNRSEIVALLELVRSLRPRTVCEIGTAMGGTLFLLAQAADPRARLLSIDVNNDPGRRQAFARFVRPGQELTCIEGSSRADETREGFRRWLGDDALELLFIDGDHSLAGVAADHQAYGPAVGPGGLIAFHDIVPDFRTRYGIDTGTRAGDVPAYWARLERSAGRTHEFVEHPWQDGCGIGVLVVRR